MDPERSQPCGHRTSCGPRATQLHHCILLFLIITPSVPLHLHPATFCHCFSLFSLEGGKRADLDLDLEFLNV